MSDEVFIYHDERSPGHTGAVVRDCSRLRGGAHVFRWSTKACVGCGLTIEGAGSVGFAIFAHRDVPTEQEWVDYCGFPEATAAQLGHHYGHLLIPRQEG
jgi:hypothetical protein